MDLKVLQYLMGHANAKTTNDIYNHVQKERAKEAVLSIEKARKMRA